NVQLRMELSGVLPGPDAEHLHRAGAAARERDGVQGQRVHGLLVADEPGERLRQARLAHERILEARLGEGDLDRAERLAVGAVDARALMGAERADPVAGAEEG